MVRKSIGQFIAALRKANGMTQKQLAEKLNVSDKAVSRWERDESAPDLSLIPVIAEIFGVTSDEILRGERRNQENEEITPQNNIKVEKQIEHLMNDARTKFTIRSIIAVGIGFVGLLAAMICNFAFYRAGLGFLIGCVLYAAAAICEILFFILATTSVKTSRFEDESINECKKNLFRTAVCVFSAIFFLLFISIPFIEQGSDYFGISFEMWLIRGGIYTIIFAVICFIAVTVANRVAVKQGFFTLNEKEQKRAAEILKLKKKETIALAVLLVATFICHFIFDNSPLHTAVWEAAAGGKEYTNMAEFKEYIEENPDRATIDGEIHFDDYETDAYETYETSVIKAADGTVLCEYKHINTNVVNVAVKYEGDEVTVVTYTTADINRAFRMVEAINTCFVAVYFLETLGVIITYNVKKRKIK